MTLDDPLDVSNKNWGLAVIFCDLGFASRHIWEMAMGDGYIWDAMG